MIRNIVRFVIVLGIIAVVSGGGVAISYALFKDRIAGREKNEKRAAMISLCPEGAAIDPEKPLSGEPFAPDAVYAARDPAGRIVAYVASGEAKGYSSTIKVLVGAKPDDLSILRTVVVSQSETPGLGTQVAETQSSYTLWEALFGPSEPGKTELELNQFLDQFRGKKVDALKDVQAITAATISSNATKRAVEEAVQRIRKAAEKKP